MNYQDHFAQQSEQYLHFRPDYPQALFDYLSSIVKTHELAWDCGTGNGQAAKALAHHFEKVIGTDINQAQLEVAFKAHNIEYRCMNAEQTDIPSHTVDLMTVAQALHWFDLPRFYEEAKRVLKPDGVICAWCYSLCVISPEVDKIINMLYFEILWWPPERAYIDEEYRTILFPFKKRSSPSFEIVKEWDLSQLIHYLQTWSAVKEYQRRHQDSPILLIFDSLQAAWGNPEKTKPVYWPIHLLLGENQLP